MYLPSPAPQSVHPGFYSFFGAAVNCGYAVALAEYALGDVGAWPTENSLTARKDGLGAAMWSGKMPHK